MEKNIGKHGLKALVALQFRGNLGYHDLAHPVLLIAVALASCLYPAPLLGASAITYVQGNYSTPQAPQTTVTVPFKSAQTAGDLNVVVVGWNDTTATVSTVKDKAGNVYTRAVGPTSRTGALSQSIYYAKNIASAAAGANAVTVTFSTAAAYPDIRILEYRGADPSNPVDVAATGSGSNATSRSAAATTSNANDLIFGANIVATLTTGPGSGFTQRLLTSPDGDIAEDKMVTAAGSYRVSAPLNSTGPWVMQMVAFHSGSSSSTTQLLSASPTSLSFGDVTLGSTSTLSVLVTNTGSGSVTVSQASITGSGLSFGGPALPTTLTSGQNATFSVTFAPTTAGSATGDLSVASNATNSPNVVSLSGTGANKHSVSLTWVSSTSPNISGYNVYRSTTSGGPYAEVNSSLVTETTYTDSTVQAGETYYYVATAVNSQGVQSGDSNQATIVVPSP